MTPDNYVHKDWLLKARSDLNNALTLVELWKQSVELRDELARINADIMQLEGELGLR